MDCATFQDDPALAVTVCPASRATQWSELVVCSSRIAGVAHVALEAGVRSQRAIGDLADRVDLGLGVVGVLGEALHQKGGDAPVLDVAEDRPERSGRTRAAW